jgi:hypothetical protein
MKSLYKCYSALLFVLLLLFTSTPARALIGQSTTLSTSAAATIVKPGVYCRTIIIQNNGSNSVRISIDGGASYTDVNSGIKGTNPTATTGYLLAAGQQLILARSPNSTQNGSVVWNPIVAIMVTGTTTLDYITDDYLSTFPTP